MLDFPCVSKRMVNTLSVIVCNYLACIWFNRENMEFIEKKAQSKGYKGKKLYKIYTQRKC